VDLAPGSGMMPITGEPHKHTSASQARDLQQRSRFPIYQSEIHQGAEMGRHQDFHGWQRCLAGQCVCGTSLAHH